ncbi:MAG: glycerophosphoryl diester phosphodiesterase membrane domain-containing protein [Acholeplasmataceae bacterium]|nr:glycerophosphoryl diester phosphodiesterase membrane domain-containing protein [Acholeplasmataceae bacterium]
MKKLFRPITNLILYDFKKLFFLEVIIKLMGLFIIFPLLKLGFYTALELSGLKYVSNTDLFIFIFKPTTIFIGILLIIIFSLYLLLEYVFLVVLYDYAHLNISMSYKTFINVGFRKFVKVLQKYNLLILLPILLFFMTIEFTQITLFSSTLRISQELIVEIQTLRYFNLVFYLTFVLLIIFFLEFIFASHHLILQHSSIKDGLNSSKKILKHNRLKILARFISSNLIINIAMLFFYGLIILIIGLFVLLYRGENVVFGIIITSMYTSYWIIGAIFSSILIPFNIALAAHTYYDKLEIKPNPILLRKQEKYKNGLTWFIKPLIIGFLIIFVLNIFTITTDIKTVNEQFQIFKQEEIIAHRGASRDAPENTLASIEIAIQQDIDAVEIDIQGTKDHIPILLHDKTLTRTTNAPTSLPVSRLDYNYIENFDAGSWFSDEFIGQKVPKLEQVFDTFLDNTSYFLDIKTYDEQTELEIFRLIEYYELENHVKVMSFDVDQLERFKTMNPDIETILLIATYYGNINSVIQNEAINHFAVRSTLIENHSDLITNIHTYGKKVYAWSVDNEASINIGVQADVDGFITKRPLISREIAHSKNSNPTFKEFLESLFD